MSRYSLLLLLLFLAFSYETAAKQYHIRSARELKALKLSPGDTVLMREGVWTNEQIEIIGKGTASHPIVVMAAKPGKVELTGKSTLRIDGTWIVVHGLYFVNGNPGQEDVVNFSDSSSWCRFTNSAIVDYNPPDKVTSNRFVSIRGTHNRVDHCFFKGKTNHGPTLVVWVSTKPNYARIDHNHFGIRDPLGENGGETIRIGTSTWSLYDSYTTVEYNLFEHCNGELEIVSNKSCHNTMRYNTFFESQGTLTLRHGNDAKVYGNLFIGNNVDKTGGVRIIGEDHVVFDNYFNGLKGSGVSAAISIMDGVKDSPLNGYYQVRNAHVLNNTFIKCEETFSLGTGKNESRNLPPVNCIIADNDIVPGNKVITFSDEVSDVTISNNKLYRDNTGVTINGFEIIGLNGFSDSWSTTDENSFHGPPLIDKAIGPDWMPAK